MSCRETCNIWFYLKKQSLKFLFGYGLIKIIRCSYFWHDSFGVYLNRWFLCPLFGHRNIKLIEDCNGLKKSLYCFACERNVK